MLVATALNSCVNEASAISPVLLCSILVEQKATELELRQDCFLAGFLLRSVIMAATVLRSCYTSDLDNINTAHQRRTHILSTKYIYGLQSIAYCVSAILV